MPVLESVGRHRDHDYFPCDDTLEPRQSIDARETGFIRANLFLLRTLFCKTRLFIHVHVDRAFVGSEHVLVGVLLQPWMGDAVDERHALLRILLQELRRAGGSLDR